MHFTRTVASVLRIRDPPGFKTFLTMEEENSPSEKPQPFKLETEVKNCIRHVYETLEESNGVNGTGKVAKSKLQVLCATISRNTAIAYSAEDLANYNEEAKSLSCPVFIQYLEDELLPRASETIDQHKIQQLCWTIVQQKFVKQEGHSLTDNEAYEQWLVFNILDLDEVSRVHKEELALLLEKLSHTMGKVWDAKPLEEFCEEEDMSFWQYVECLEKCYLAGADKSIYKEGLDEITDYVLHEVIKQGYLIKKGHMVKSMKDRWFVLKPGNLSYFTNRSCNEKKGEIIISQDTKAVGLPDSRKYRFNVVCGGTKTHYDLEARDQRTKQEWMVAIQKVIDTTEGPSVQKKERLQRRLERNERRLEKLEEERKKREQEDLLLAQQRELELLRQKYSDAEAQAIIEAENLQEEKRRREELERLHQELQNLLLAEKEAREAEAVARALQEALLEEEKRRLEEMERMKAEMDTLLEDELKKRETLEERQKLQDKMLEEERQRLENLEKARQATEQAMKEAQDKLAAAEEAARKASEEAKKKVREIKTCSGLAKPIGPHNPQFITHRGIGAFCEGDFDKISKHHEKTPPKVLPKPKKIPKDGEVVVQNGVVDVEGMNGELGNVEEETSQQTQDASNDEEIKETKLQEGSLNEEGNQDATNESSKEEVSDKSKEHSNEEGNLDATNESSKEEPVDKNSESNAENAGQQLLGPAEGESVAVEAEEQCEASKPESDAPGDIETVENNVDSNQIDCIDVEKSSDEIREGEVQTKSDVKSVEDVPKAEMNETQEVEVMSSDGFELSEKSNKGPEHEVSEENNRELEHEVSEESNKDPEHEVSEESNKDPENEVSEESNKELEHEVSGESNKEPEHEVLEGGNKEPGQSSEEQSALAVQQSEHESKPACNEMPTEESTMTEN